MSHLMTAEVTFTDLECLFKGLENCGLEVRNGQTHFKNYYSSKKKDLCDHAAGVPGNARAYEVGIVRQDDGSYKLSWDYFCGGEGLTEHISNNPNGSDCGKVEHEYSIEVAKKWAVECGFQYERVGKELHIQHPDGMVKVVQGEKGMVVSGNGFSGGTCTAPITALSNAIGNVKSIENTSDFYTVDQTLNVMEEG